MAHSWVPVFFSGRKIAAFYIFDKAPVTKLQLMAVGSRFFAREVGIFRKEGGMTPGPELHSIS